MKWEIAIHRWKFDPANSQVMKHAEELSGLLNSGFIFMSQVTTSYPKEDEDREEDGMATTPDVYIVTTFKREMRGKSERTLSA